MAEIFLAREFGPGGLERPVVVKRILPHLAADAEFVELFRQEARVVARLQHPGIVQIYEFAQADGSWYIAMEYVPGVTVKQLSSATAHARRPMPLPVALGIVIQACEGAHAAHELADPAGHTLGLVHRDISPHNLMVTDEGHVKLLDFGIAKATAASEATRTGGVKGKTSYLSPEQCRQDPLDRRSDVFALGIVLWELVAGTSLFKRDSEYETLQAIDRAELRDLRKFRPEVPPALHAAIRKALARKRDDRYPTAEAMRLALAKVAHDLGFDTTHDAVKAFALEVVGERRRDERAAIDSVFAGVDVLPAAMGARLAGQQQTDETDTVVPHEDSRSTLRGLRRRRRRVWAVALGLGLALAAAAGYLARRPHPRVLEGTPLALGFPPALGSAVMASELEPLRGYLETRTGRPFVFTFARSYDELGNRLVSGELQFAMLTPYLLLTVMRHEPRIVPLAGDLFDGSAGNNGVILVPEKSSMTTVAELRGMRFCLTDTQSTTGYVLPRAALRQAGLDPDVDIRPVMSGNHLQAMRDLSEGRCDAAGTYDKAYISADRAGVAVASVRVLAITGRAPNETICAAVKTSKKDRDAVRAALLDFQPQRDIGQPSLGNVQRISGFAPFDAAAFDRLRVATDMAAPKP